MGGQVLSDMHMIAPTDEMADLIAEHNPDIYEYHFSTPGDSFHSVELNYVFGAPFSGLFADEMTINGSVDQFNHAQRQLCRDVIRLWTNFAKYGRVTCFFTIYHLTHTVAIWGYSYKASFLCQTELSRHL